MYQRNRMLLAASAAAAVAFLTHGFVGAAVKNWTNPAGGTFEADVNWSPNGVPGPADNAEFALNAAGYTVTFGAAHTNNVMTVRTDRVSLDLGGFSYTLPNGMQVGQSVGEIGAAGT
jgi:hypothetical protein